LIRLQATEGQALEVSAEYDGLIRAALGRLQRQLATRVPLSTEEAGRPVVRNLIGTISLRQGILLEVAPKIDADENWVSATLDLLSNDRIDLVGDRLSGLSPAHAGLLDALARSYAERLRRALQRDGPLLILQRVDRELGVLRGSLRVTTYLRRYPVKPHRFPVTFDVLSADNEFTRALALVARTLAVATTSFEVRSALLECAGALRPGCPDDAPVNPSVLGRSLPPQWAVYKPAWSIAVSVLSRSSLLRSSGSHHGLEVAIEAWPLLETLLLRVLSTAAAQANNSGRNLVVMPKRGFALLTNPSVGVVARDVEPDGELSENGSTLATFEAKYSAGPSGNAWPPREHVFQALATAAARHSPLAVLVYPGSFSPVWWDVEGFHGHPANLVAVGLRMFSYRKGSGEADRAAELLTVLSGRPSAIPTTPVAASTS
jgi:hypothetical protein